MTQKIKKEGEKRAAPSKNETKIEGAQKKEKTEGKKRARRRAGKKFFFY